MNHSIRKCDFGSGIFSYSGQEYISQHHNIESLSKINIYDGWDISDSMQPENIGIILYVEYCETLDLRIIIEISSWNNTRFCNFRQYGGRCIILMEYIDSHKKECHDRHDPELLCDTIDHEGKHDDDRNEIP